MLSRTADHLYWMARFIERAENTARMLDVNYRMTLLPQNEEQIQRIWGSTLLSMGYMMFFCKIMIESRPKMS